jgi:hypothetical protein
LDVLPLDADTPPPRLRGARVHRFARRDQDAHELPEWRAIFYEGITAAQLDRAVQGYEVEVKYDLHARRACQVLMEGGWAAFDEPGWVGAAPVVAARDRDRGHGRGQDVAMRPAAAPAVAMRPAAAPAVGVGLPAVAPAVAAGPPILAGVGAMASRPHPRPLPYELTRAYRIANPEERACIKHGIPWLLENPLSSLPWLAPPISWLLGPLSVQQTIVHQCQYGTSLTKPTHLYLGNLSADLLACTCRQKEKTCSATGRPHYVLNGTTKSVFCTQAAKESPSQMRVQKECRKARKEAALAARSV